MLLGRRGSTASASSSYGSAEDRPDPLVHGPVRKVRAPAGPGVGPRPGRPEQEQHRGDDPHDAGDQHGRAEFVDLDTRAVRLRKEHSASIAIDPYTTGGAGRGESCGWR